MIGGRNATCRNLRRLPEEVGKPTMLEPQAAKVKQKVWELLVMQEPQLGG